MKMQKNEVSLQRGKHNMEKVKIVMTCFNRKEFTRKSIISLYEGNPLLDLKFIVVDDRSNDGTADALKKLLIPIEIEQGTGCLFWNGGMHKGLQTIIDSKQGCDYVVLVNDDVIFAPNCLEKMIEQSKIANAVIVGTIKDSQNRTSYGGIHFTSKRRIKYTILEPNTELDCDTFNANCVLIPYRIFMKVGNLDPVYKHSMGDFDYGIKIRRKGFLIQHTSFYVGVCNDNSVVGTWQDTTLSRKKRLYLKESPKGLPIRDWFHFAYKNFGFRVAIYHMLTPYTRIVLKK